MTLIYCKPNDSLLGNMPLTEVVSLIENLKDEVNSHSITPISIE